MNQDTIDTLTPQTSERRNDDIGLFGDISLQPSFGFPEPLSEKYRPRKMADFVGLDKPRKILTAFSRKPFPSAWLFKGPSGTGKTTIALALAQEIRAEVHHIPAKECTLETVQTVTSRCWYVPMEPNSFHLILVDEADQMSYAAQLALLSKLDSTCFPPNTVFVFTCNATENLEARFLSRCRTLEFSSYGMAPSVVALLSRIWEIEAPTADKPNFARIVKDSNNNVRDALMSLEVELLGI